MTSSRPAADSGVGGVIAAPPRRPPRPPAPIAWIAVIPFAVWATVRLSGADRGPVAPLLAFTPYAAVGSVLSVFVAAAARSRAAVALGTATAVLMAALTLPRAVGSPVTATGPTLRILTANLFLGRGDPRAVVALARRLRADVVSLQELTPELAQGLRAAGMSAIYRYARLEPGPGASGSGLYSRLPLTPLPDFRPAGGHRMPWATLSPSSGPAVEFVDVHVVSPLGTATSRWADDLRGLPAPVSGAVRVLAGDFNATLDQAALREVLSPGYADAADSTGDGLVFTWPADRRFPPLVTIDHVLYDRRASAVTTAAYTVPGSDHRALFAELRLPG
ncbi:endonuclease/exonuclease/phosphatase family protein [Microbispora sp. RL4-1S]|uniref:Endonuclease/exonuclease/phosphatase family protein n=1 Tax=Microbispora oryzae TaxID=2806554 RepID=A0A941ALS8_9ACTN|nr:endonuclease/exonuclease/phosphatase family protein [Microbispora oryzae]MBP2707592.1 endonuclease/exonuclease/phosphatase family protein [Microbispora oryzae]